ncbi:MAG: phospholipid carrier-dependent glycosyltransferase [Gemmatimonadales bacterium]
MIARSTAGLLACAAIVLAGLAFDLGGYPLLDPDEGRNAEIAREMAATNDYVLPRLNGLPYLDKPVLYFAAGAAVVEVLGPTELAVRVPSLLFTLATLLVVAWFADRLWGRATAWTAAIATAATPFTLAYAHTVIFDSALTFFVVSALVGFFMATEGRRPSAAVWCAAAWVAVALGVLTKGPIALAVPLMVVVPYAAWRHRLRALFDPVGVLLFPALVLPWVLAVSQDVPDFLGYALVTETARRLTTDELGRTGPIWYFLAIFPAAALPWSIVLVAGWLERRRARDRRAEAASPAGTDRRLVFLALWILVPLLFFSLSQSKRPQYVLPLVPAAGLLVAALWHGVRGRLPGARAGAAGLLLIGVGLLIAGKSIPGLVPATPAVAQAIPGTALALGLVCIAAGIAGWVAASRREVALIALCLPVAAIPFVSRGLMDAIGNDRSAAALAEAVNRVAGPQTQVVGVHAFPLSLPFYLRRTIVLSTADGSELTSNYLLEHYREWRGTPGTPLRHPDWWLEALASCERPRVFVARADDDATLQTLARELPLLAHTRKYVAYGPCAEALLAAAPLVATQRAAPYHPGADDEREEGEGEADG